MKIYAVVLSDGEYDYYSENRKYYINKQKAEEFIKKYNIELGEEKKEIEKCNNCVFADVRFEFVNHLNYPQCFFKSEAVGFCSDIICKNKKYDNQNHFASLEEIEIVE